MEEEEVDIGARAIHSPLIKVANDPCDNGVIFTAYFDIDNKNSGIFSGKQVYVELNEYTRDDVSGAGLYRPTEGEIRKTCRVNVKRIIADWWCRI